jgi:hypothetical protein
MAQVVECLPRRLEALSSNPKLQTKQIILGFEWGIVRQNFSFSKYCIAKSYTVVLGLPPYT